jgi:uncharacterized DUF497 family protein
VEYEWDDSKRALNRRKHGIDFIDAIAAVEDPNRLDEIEAETVFGEERINIIGMAHDRVLFVVTTLRGEDMCRIISARKATRHEQERYYAGDRDAW